MTDLVSLARKYPAGSGEGDGQTWLKARATALAFSLLPSTSLPMLAENTPDGESEPIDEEDIPRKADLDVLPTLLAYRDGELLHSWIRVDWCAPQGVEALLRR